ncbi:SGNH/GDSL hydrolase family protein [Cysteiniphilum sp. 6C5]|uniref:SGNH/GDSL hydrolase family protein n=1 Tax=unclassified Cysteiniphilum TaxID=2610889 RepID=UPI003F83B2A1
MMQLNNKWRSIFYAFGLSMVASYTYAKAGVNVYVDNHCDKIQYIESQVDGVAKPVKEIRPYQRTFLEYNDTGYLSYDSDVKYSVYQDNAKQNALATVDIALHNSLRNNQYTAMSSNEGNIAIDMPSRSWHNWIGTPSVTMQLCPRKQLEISKNALLDGVKRVIVFGDSLSDEGNLFSMTQGAVPSARSYYNGMFTNGNTWSAILRGKLSAQDIQMSNYAVGDATTLSYADTEHLPYTLTYQTYMYHANALNENWQDIDSTLAIIWIGGNDYLTQPLKLDEKAQQQLTTEVVANIKATIYDYVHPTEQVHKVIYKEMAKNVS